MSSTKVRQAMSSYWVLTYNSEDERLQEIFDLINGCNLPVYLSKVCGFGMPELRIDSDDYIRGIGKIFKFLKEQEPLPPIA